MPRTLVVGILVVSALLANAREMRHFTFHYSFAVRAVPLGARLRVWIPRAHSGRYQQVRILSAVGDLPLRTTRESRYGNEMFYAESHKTTKHEYHFVVDYDVKRYEHLAFTSTVNPGENAASPRELNQDLQPDALVPVTGLPSQLAADAVRGQTTPVARAHAIYDYVYNNMRYEKTGTGWGRGDALYACAAKKGNCTDFHSLFIAMARSQKIPARFEIGYPLPEDRHSGEIAGYHCWSEFYAPEAGWIPVDISGAWQDPALRDYFFGAHDANRVQFTVGRDLRLNPPQNGPPLNYFVYPYVEVLGMEYPNVVLHFAFRDLPRISRTKQRP